ncbi:MAG: SRPBCC family protein [Ardenticatenales bacterium]
MEFHSTIRIDAPADRVWATVIDLSKLIARAPGVVAVEPADVVPVQGASVTVTVEQGGRRVRVPATLRTMTPPSRLVIDAELPEPIGAPGEATLVLTPAGTATDVQLGVTVKLGMLKEMAAKAIVGARGQAALDEALAGLKRQVEGA